MIALILGGGMGSRLYPLTEKHAKPAVPLAGKYRLIDIPISNCLNSGIREIFVLTQFNSASLNRHIKNTYCFDHFSSGFVDILAAEQTRNNHQWFQGTADAVRQSIRYLQNTDAEQILILSGDQLYQMNYAELLASHQKNRADLTIATIPVTAKDATGFGIMKVNKQGKIISFIEKPDRELLPGWVSDVADSCNNQKKHYLASMGIYLFNKNTLTEVLEKYPTANDFGKEIIPELITANYEVASSVFDGYWEDIGTISSFMEANLALTEPIPEFNLFDNHNKIYTNPRTLPPAKITKSVLDQSIVAEGSIIQQAIIERSVIGVRARIEPDTIIKNSLVMGNDRYESLQEISRLKSIHEQPHLGIGKNCHIENAIIDKNCAIGNGVVIKGGANLEYINTPDYCIREGIIIIKEGAVIKANTIIGNPLKSQVSSVVETT